MFEERLGHIHRNTKRNTKPPWIKQNILQVILQNEVVEMVHIWYNYATNHKWHNYATNQTDKLTRLVRLKISFTVLVIIILKCTIIKQKRII